MEVLLAPEETETLLEVLRSYSADLRMEIVDTDNPTYKRPLKHQRDVIDTIVSKLHAATTPNSDAPIGDNGTDANGTDTNRTDAIGRVSLRVVAVW